MTAPRTDSYATRTRRRRSAGTLSSLRRRFPDSGTVTGALSAAVIAGAVWFAWSVDLASWAFDFSAQEEVDAVGAASGGWWAVAFLVSVMAVAAVLVAAVAVFDGAYWAHALRSSASAVVLVLLVGEFVMLAAAAGAGAALSGGGS